MAFLCLLSSAVVYSQEKPKTYSLVRYSVIWENSLFATNIEGKAVPNTTDYWSLSGVFTFSGGQGAVIVNQVNGDVEQIETGKINDAGFALKEVVGLDKSEPLKVRVEKEGQSFWVMNIQKQRKRKTLSTTNQLVFKEISSTRSVFQGYDTKGSTLAREDR